MSKTKISKETVSNEPIKVEKKVSKIVKKSEIELVSFSVKATIPTQQYGNIMPEIVVRGTSIEDARDTVMPIIETMYQTYAEEPLNGRTPKFFNKASVTVTEKKVEPVVQPVTSSTKVEKFTDKQSVVKDEAFIKAEGAINSAVSREALDLIEQKIKDSVKIKDTDKPILYALVLNKRKEHDK